MADQDRKLEIIDRVSDLNYAIANAEKEGLKVALSVEGPPLEALMSGDRSTRVRVIGVSKPV